MNSGQPSNKLLVGKKCKNKKQNKNEVSNKSNEQQAEVYYLKPGTVSTYIKQDKHIQHNLIEKICRIQVNQPKPIFTTATDTTDYRNLVQIQVKETKEQKRARKKQRLKDWLPKPNPAYVWLKPKPTEKLTEQPQTSVPIQTSGSDIGSTTRPQSPEKQRYLQSAASDATPSKPITLPAKLESKIKFNMLPTSNQNNNSGPKMPKYRAGIPRSFYAAEFNNSNIPNEQLTEQPYTSVPIKPSGFTIGCPPRSQSPEKQRYSPSDAYLGSAVQEKRDGSESPDFTDKCGLKRQSAFERLGPRDEPKKPKLTINLMCIRDQSVREVVDETNKEDRFLPVHLRKDLIESKDEVVTKFLPVWPWKKNMSYLSYRNAKSSTHEPELVDEYAKTHSFFEICIKGYPAKWRKEDVLDVLLENVKGKSLIPCFIEFTPKECKMLVIRCAPALLAIHKLGYFLRKNTVELQVGIGSITLTINHIDFIPRLILRKMLAQGYDDERKLNLKAFTLKPDISHFIYFPLNREQNQIELFQMLNVVAWDYLTDLDLSHNRLRFLDGFDLPNAVPKLKTIDLSYNCFEKITPLLPLRNLTINSIKLEGNPLCYNYTDPAHYVKVLRMIFPSLKYIDDLPILLKGELPPCKPSYCPESAAALVNKFLETFFPLLEGSLEDKAKIANMYDKKAVMTVTMAHELRSSRVYRIFRNLFAGVRYNDLMSESTEGDSAIASIISKWPSLQHDPQTFTVDIMYHSDTSTVLRISGVLKITAHTLADDEYYLSFTRSMLLMSKNGVHYKIQNELLFWEEPSKEILDKAFRVNTVRVKPLNLKIDSLDQETKENLIAIFMTITDLDKKSSERCLELKEWNLKLALEHFMKLLKLDDIQSLCV